MGVDPITIGLAAVSAVSAFAGSQGQAAQAKYQAQVAKNNQAIANMNARYAAIAGQQKEQAEAWKVRGLIGQQEAAQAANGLDINSGSPAAVRASTAALGNVSFGNIRDNTAREYYGYKGQATQFGNEAALDKASAPTLFESLLSGATAAGKTFAGLGGLSGGGGGAGTAAGIGRTGISAGNLSASGGFKAAPIGIIF